MAAANTRSLQPLPVHTDPGRALYYSAEGAATPFPTGSGSEQHEHRPRRIRCHARRTAVLSAMANGTMQHWPLTVTQLIEHAARWHGEQEVICKTVEVKRLRPL